MSTDNLGLPTSLDEEEKNRSALEEAERAASAARAPLPSADEPESDLSAQVDPVADASDVPRDEPVPAPEPSPAFADEQPVPPPDERPEESADSSPATSEPEKIQPEWDSENGWEEGWEDREDRRPGEDDWTTLRRHNLADIGNELAVIANAARSNETVDRTFRSIDGFGGAGADEMLDILANGTDRFLDRDDTVAQDLYKTLERATDGIYSQLGGKIEDFWIGNRRVVHDDYAFGVVRDQQDVDDRRRFMDEQDARARQMAKEVAFLKQNHDRSLFGRMLWHVRNDEDWNDERFGVFDGTNKLTLNEIEEVAGMSGFKEAKNHVAQERFDALAKAVHERYLKERGERSVLEAASDNFRGGLVELGTMEESLRNLLVNGGSGEAFMRRARELKDVEELNAAETPTGRDFTEIGGPLEALGWMFQQFSRLAPQMIAQFGIALGTGGAGNLAAGAAGRMGASAATKAAIRSGFSRVGGYATTVALDVADVTGQLAGEAAERGQEGIDLGELALVSVPFVGADLYGSIGRGVRRAAGKAAGDIARDMAKSAQVYTARGFWHDVLRGSTRVLKDAGLEGATEAAQDWFVRLGNLGKNGTLALAGQGEESFDVFDAMLGSAETFFAAAASGGAGAIGSYANFGKNSSFTGEYWQQKRQFERSAPRVDRYMGWEAGTTARIVRAGKAGSDVESARNGYGSVLAEILRDQAAGNATRLDALDATLLGQAIVAGQAIKDLESVSRNAERSLAAVRAGARIEKKDKDGNPTGEFYTAEELLRFKERTDHALENARGVKSQKRDNMGDNAKGILDALDATIGGPTLAEGVRMQRERVAAGAQADPIRTEGFDVPVVPPSVDERTGVVTTVYMEREQEGSSHRMQIVETLDPDSGDIVYRVKNLRSDARPADAASEFLARDFGGDDKAALAAALDFARDYADWSAVGAAANEAFDRAAASYVEANYPGRLAICADNETELFAKLADAGIDLASGDYRTDTDERLRSLFHGSQESALTVPPLADRDGPVFSVIVRARNATPATLAATLDHETMHVDFARRIQEAVSRRENPKTGRMELANKPLLDELFAGWKKPDGTPIDPAELSPAFLQRRVRVALLGLDRDGRGNPLSQEAVLEAMADDEAQEREEELYAYATESVNAGASEGTGLVAGLVHPFRARKMRILRQTHPELVKFAGAYVAGRLGAFTGGMGGGVVTDMWEDTAATDDEIADYLFRLRQPPASDYAPNPHADDPEGARRALGVEPSAPEEGRTSGAGESGSPGAPAPAERNYASREEIVADLAAARENMAGLRRANAESSQIDEAASRVRRLQGILREWDESHREAPRDARPAPRGAPAEAPQPQRPAPAETSPQENRTGSKAPEEPAPSATPEPAPAEPRPIPKGDGRARVPAAGKGKVSMKSPDRSESFDGTVAYMDLGDIVNDQVPGFDMAFQNRGQNDAAREVKAKQIGMNPDADTLTDAGTMIDEGTIVVAKVDGKFMVIAGNTRAWGLQLAAQLGKLGPVTERVRADAAMDGVDLSGMANPVKVRVLSASYTHEQLEHIAEVSNRQSKNRVADENLALDDAKKILSGKKIKGASGSLLDMFAPGPDGQLDNASNRDFMMAFIAETGDNALLGKDKDGRPIPNAQAYARAQRALVAAVLFGENADRAETARMLGALMGEGAGMKKLAAGIAAAAPSLVAAFRGNKAFDLSPELRAALNEIAQARADGVTVDDRFAQATMDLGDESAAKTGPNAPALVKDIARALWSRGVGTGRGVSGKAVRELLLDYAERVYRPAKGTQPAWKLPAEDGEGLFGDALRNTKQSVWNAALAAAMRDDQGLGLRSRNGEAGIRARNDDGSLKIASHERKQVLADAERKFGKKPLVQVPPRDRIQTVFVQSRKALGAAGVQPSAAMSDATAEIVYRYDGDGKAFVLARLPAEYPGLDRQRYMFGSKEADEAAKRRERRELGRIARRNNGNGRFDGIFQPLLLGPGPRARNGEFSPQTPAFKAQLDDVIARYKGTPQWLKAPNGKDSILAATPDYGPLLWATVRTQSFKDWFGDWENDPANASKVVDANGEPRVVYHGTGSEEEFESFDRNRVGSRFENVDVDYNFFFTASELAAEGYGEVYPFFLNIRNPEIRNVRFEEGEEEVGDLDLHEDIINAHDFGSGQIERSGAKPENADGLIMGAFRTPPQAEREITERHAREIRPELERLQKVDEDDMALRDEKDALWQSGLDATVKALRDDDNEATRDLIRDLPDDAVREIARIKYREEFNGLPRVKEINEILKRHGREDRETRLRLADKLNAELAAAGRETLDSANIYAVDDPNNIKSIFNSGAFSASDSRVRARGGEIGGARLGITADEAKRMEAAGATREEIWRATGWWRGKDGKWGFELDPIPLEEFDKIYGILKKELREHPLRYNNIHEPKLAGRKYAGVFMEQAAEKSPWLHRLLLAYPRLRNVGLAAWPSKRVLGKYYGVTRFHPLRPLGNGQFDPVDIHIGLQFRKKESIWLTFMHEIQHTIQAYEGFPNGNASEKAVVAEDPSGGEDGEIEAQLVSLRATMTEDERRSEPPWETERRMLERERENDALASILTKAKVPEREFVRKTGGLYSLAQERILDNPPMTREEVIDYVNQIAKSIGAEPLRVRQGDSNMRESSVRARNSVSVAAAGRLGITNEEAERLEREGYFPDEIFRRTRWYRGVKDDEWRYELEPVQLRPWLTAWGDAPVRRAGGKRRAIADIIGEDSPFLRAYPAARNITVEIKENKDGGEGELVGDRITVWGRKGQTLAEFAQDKGDNGLLNSLVHELQHWVQNQEGWPEGSSPGNFRSDRKSRRLRQAENERSQAFWNARRLAAQHGYDTSPDAVEDRARRGGDEAAVSDMEALLPEQGETAAEEEPWVADLRERVGRYRQAVANVKRIADEDGYQTAWDKYNRVAGEVESRNAGSRAAMSSGEAAENPPWTTMDVSPLRQTIVRNGEVVAANARPAGRQKQAGVAYPDARAEIEALDLRPGLGTSAEVRARNRDEIMGVLSSKRPDLDAGAVADEILKFATPKERKLALHWVVRGAIRLPEDAYKVEDAVSVAEKAKVDPFRYASPLALLEAHKQFKPSARPIDPATVPELTDQRDEGDGIVSYLVQDDRQGQAAMRKIIDTHWGEDANPWCLLAKKKKWTYVELTNDYDAYQEMERWWAQLPHDERVRIAGDRADEESVMDADPASEYYVDNVVDNPVSLDDAWDYWQHYSALPKRVAFKDGKLLAFMATEDKGDDAVNLEDRLEELRSELRGERGMVETGNFARESEYWEAKENDDQATIDEIVNEWDEWVDSDAVSASYDDERGVATIRNYEGDSFFDEDENGNPREYRRRADGSYVFGGEAEEEWWDRQDVSHPNLDWARGDASGVRARNADETMAARLGLGNADEARRMEREGASRLDIWRRTGWWKRPEDGMWRIELPPLKFKTGAFERLYASIHANQQKLKGSKYTQKNLPTYEDWRRALESGGNDDQYTAPAAKIVSALFETVAVWSAVEIHKAETGGTQASGPHRSWFYDDTRRDKYGAMPREDYETVVAAIKEWKAQHPEQARILQEAERPRVSSYDWGNIVERARKLIYNMKHGAAAPRELQGKLRMRWADIAADENRVERPNTLRELLSDDDPVLKALPELGDFPIVFQSDTGRYGGWAGTDNITLNTIWTNDRMGATDAVFDTRKTLAHEIQHKVQAAVGFMRGVNPDAVKRAREDRSYRYDPWTNEQLRGDENLTPEQVYMGWGGEVEARAVEARMHLTDEQRKEIPPWVTEEVVREDKFGKRTDYSYAAQKRAMEEMQWVEESSVNDPNGPQYRPLSGEQAQTERRPLGNPEQLTFDFIPPTESVVESVSDAMNLGGVRARNGEFATAPEDIGRRVMGYNVGTRAPDLTPVDVTNSRTGKPERAIAFPGDRPEGYVPSRIGYAYKLMEQWPDGSLHALFANVADTVPQNEWMFAAGFPLTDRNVNGMKLRQRYAWHLGFGLPTAPHLMSSKDYGRGYPTGAENGKGHPKGSRRVWVRVAFDASNDWNAAMDRVSGREGGDPYGLIPFGGYYGFIEGNKSNWILSSAVKFDKVLSEDERQEILRGAGFDERAAWEQRHGGKKLGAKNQASKPADKIAALRELRDRIARSVVDNPEQAAPGARARNDAEAIAAFNALPPYPEIEEHRANRRAAETKEDLNAEFDRWYAALEVRNAALEKWVAAAPDFLVFSEKGVAKPDPNGGVYGSLLAWIVSPDKWYEGNQHSRPWRVTSVFRTGRVSKDGYEELVPSGHSFYDTKKDAVFSIGQVISGTAEYAPGIRARNGQAYYGELFPEMGVDAANRPFAFTQAEILARMRGLIPGYDYKPEHIEEIEYIRKGMEILERDPDAVDNIRRKTVGVNRPAPLSPDEQYVLYTMQYCAEKDLETAIGIRRKIERSGAAVPGQLAAAKALEEAAEAEALSLALTSQRVGSALGRALAFRQVAYRWNGMLSYEGLVRSFNRSLRRTAERYGGIGIAVDPNALKLTDEDREQIRRIFEAVVAAQRQYEQAKNAATAADALRQLMAIMRSMDRYIRNANRKPLGKPTKPKKLLPEADLMAQLSRLADEEFGLEAASGNLDPRDRTAWARAANIVKLVGNWILSNDIAQNRPLRSAESFRQELFDRCDAILGRYIQLSAREYGEIFSDYGMVREASKNELFVRRTKVNQALRLLSQIAAVERGDAPRRTGQQRVEGTDEQTDLERRLHVLLKELDPEAERALRRGGEPSDRFVKTPLQIWRDAAEKEIRMLETAIATGVELERNQIPLQLGEEEMSLKELLELKRQRYREMFVLPKTEEEQVQAYLRQLVNRENALLAELDAARRGEFKHREDKNARAKQDSRVQALQREIAAIREEIQAERDLQGDALSTRNKRIKAVLNGIQRSMANANAWIENPELYFEQQERRRKSQEDIENDPAVKEARRAQREILEKWEAVREERAYKKLNALGKGVAAVGGLRDAIKVFLASGDISGVGVQCALAVLDLGPAEALKAIRVGIGALAGGKNAVFGKLSEGKTAEEFAREKFDELVKNNTFLREAVDEYGVHISTVEANGRYDNSEEGFARGYATRRAEEWMQRNLGAVGRAAKGYVDRSDRAFALPADILRLALCKKLADASAELKGGALTAAEKKYIGRIVNAATGRGDFFGHAGFSAALSRFFWAPARFSGQLQMLALPFTMLVHKDVSGRVKAAIARKFLVRTMANYGIAVMIAYLLKQAFGDDDDDGPLMETDPRSAKFGRINLGGRMFSLTGGLESYITLGARVLSGETKTKNGDIMKVGQGGDSRFGLVWRMFENKMTPDVNILRQMINKKKTTGERIEGFFGKNGYLSVIAGNSIFPLTVSDMVDVLKDDKPGLAEKAFLAGITVLGYNSTDFGYNDYDAHAHRFDRAHRALRDAKTPAERRRVMESELGPYAAQDARGEALRHERRQIDVALRTERDPNRRAALLARRDRNEIRFLALWREGLREEAESWTPDMDEALKRAGAEIRRMPEEERESRPLNYW